MNNMGDNQGDESAYQDASYYAAMDNSLADPENEYSTGDMEQRSPLREQDRFLPIANVSKIMKKAIPPQGKVAKDAKECVQECVSEFISFITSEAAERCQNEKRKTINGEDLLWAMSNLGFDNYVEPLKTFLLKYRDAIKIDSSIINSSAEIAVLQHQQQQQAAQQAAAAAQHAHPGTVIVAAPNIISSAALGQRQVTINGAPAGATIELQGAAGSEVKQVVVEGGELKPGTTLTQAAGATGHLTMSNPATGQTFLVPFNGQVAIVNGNPVVNSATT